MIQKCPICKGCGLVPGGFYTSLQGHIDQWTSGSSSEICRACNGCGIITQYCIEGDGQNIHLKPIEQGDKEDSITVLKEIRQLLKDILNHQEKHV